VKYAYLEEKKTMEIQRNEDEITFRLSSKNLNIIQLQAIADWLEYIELTGFKNISEEEILEISKQAKKGRWDRLRHNLDL
jgi:hypothetical protein